MSQNDIKGGAKMTGGEYKMVFFEIKNLGKINSRYKIEARKRTANVAAARLINQLEKINAEFLTGLEKRMLEHRISIGEMR